MSIEGYYNWFLPDLTEKISENEDFLDILLSCEDFLFTSCIVSAFVPVLLYYTLYTKCCFWGYHYRVKHWAVWMIVFFAIMTTIAWSWPLQELDELYMDDLESIKWRLYFGNVVLFLFFSFVFSWFWCQFLPTNAYRFLKIRH